MNIISELGIRLNPPQKKALEKLAIKNAEDILRHFPSRYEMSGERKLVVDLRTGDNAIIYGKVSSVKTKKGWKSLSRF